MKTYKNIQPKASKRYGPRDFNDDYNMTVDGDKVHIFGTKVDGREQPKRFSVRFAIGDKVVYDSYNLTYLAPIIKVTAKTVTVMVDHRRSETIRLSHESFVWQNWDFNLRRIQDENAQTSQYI